MSSHKTSAFPHAHHKHMEALQLCLTVCSSCAAMCLEEGRKETAKLCFDCADICSVTIQLHARDSVFNDALMKLCADACTRCGEACGKVQTEHCQQCSEVCKECAKSCKS